MLKSKLNLAAVGVLAATLSMQSMAQEVATAQAPLSVDELSFAFADVAQADVLAMSQGEMVETEGAWVNWAAGGALGGLGYGYGVYRGNYDWNTTKFLGNVATGAVIGGTFGAAGVAASGGARFIPSLTNVGANVWRANAVTANWGVNHGWRR